MKDPIILEGPPIDWGHHREQSQRVMDPSGEINWGAAFGADPGVMSCPHCKTHLWQGGYRVKCPECSTEFDTPLRLRQAELVEIACPWCDKTEDKQLCVICRGTRKVTVSKRTKELMDAKKGSTT